ncbi:MAG: LytTR family DNA-binding domain-containing protein [Blautia sp.]|nr:LytTR family DNA-binding domain-containing protein [Blautia sp.]
MKLAIVEDEAAQGRLLEQYIESWGKKNDIPVSVKIYASAESFLFQWEDEPADAVFADIQMPGMDGMEMIRRLREKDARVPVIFTTGVADYMQEGYEVEALNYLLKPLSGEKVSACLDKAFRRHEAAEFLVAETLDGVRKLPLEALNYCEAAGHNTELGLAGGEKLFCASSLSKLEKELGEKGFVKCHRSYLCNISNLNRITAEALVFDDGTGIPVSRRLYRTVNRAFIDRFSRKDR